MENLVFLFVVILFFLGIIKYIIRSSVVEALEEFEKKHKKN